MSPTKTRRAAAAQATDPPAGATIPYLDPYALWALETGFRAFKRKGRQSAGEMTFLVELQDPYQPGSDFVTANAPAAATGDGTSPVTIGGVELRVPLAYAEVLPVTGERTRFITLRLPIKQLNDTDLKAYVQRLVHNHSPIKRLQIGFQRPGWRTRWQAADPMQDDSPVTEPASEPPPVVLGLVEDVCPFAHAAVQHDGGTRIVALWDQSLVQKVVAPWEAPAQFPYGRLLGQKAMNALIAQHQDDGVVDEEALYADPRVAMPELMQRASHGAAVLDLLAGPLPARGRLTPDDGMPRPPADTPDAAVAPAPPMPVLVVRLPREQTTISSGRWLAVNALDALHALIGLSRGLAPTPPALVVSISYGAIAGPHDGSSLVEAAIDALCAGHGELAVVMAAGNARGTLQDTESADPQCCLPGGVHARQVLLPGHTVTLTLRVPAEKPFETYLELWFSDLARDDDADQWLDPQDVSVRVTPPGGPNWRAVGCDDRCFARDEAGEVMAGLVFERYASQSLHRSMALLVVAATETHPDFVKAPAGHWTLEIRNTGTRTLSVQAWVERDDSIVGIDRPQSAHLVPNLDGAAAHLNDDNIFSTLAGGHHTWPVGALLHRSDALGHWRASAYTAAGPSDQRGPVLSALVDAGTALGGMRVAGSRSGMVLRANGTSMAAPMAARWIANRLAGNITPRVTLAELRDELKGQRIDARRGKPLP
jgi:hypothetical protein